jgi:hypothetical protein
VSAKQAAVMKKVDFLHSSSKSAAAKAASAKEPGFNFGAYMDKMVSFLARNFFTMKFIALVKDWLGAIYTHCKKKKSDDIL